MTRGLAGRAGEPGPLPLVPRGCHVQQDGRGADSHQRDTRSPSPQRGSEASQEGQRVVTRPRTKGRTLLFQKLSLEDQNF